MGGRGDHEETTLKTSAVQICLTLAPKCGNKGTPALGSLLGAETCSVALGLHPWPLLFLLPLRSFCF